MTNKHLRLHMIISAASAIVTVALSIVLRDQYATQSAGQRAKLSSLHIGIAAFQMLGCLFAFRTQAHALQVEKDAVARRDRLQKVAQAAKKVVKGVEANIEKTKQETKAAEARDGAQMKGQASQVRALEKKLQQKEKAQAAGMRGKIKKAIDALRKRKQIAKEKLEAI